MCQRRVEERKAVLSAKGLFSPTPFADLPKPSLSHFSDILYQSTVPPYYAPSMALSRNCPWLHPCQLTMGAPGTILSVSPSHVIVSCTPLQIGPNYPVEQVDCVCVCHFKKLFINKYVPSVRVFESIPKQ